MMACSLGGVQKTVAPVVLGPVANGGGPTVIGVSVSGELVTHPDSRNFHAPAAGDRHEADSVPRGRGSTVSSTFSLQQELRMLCGAFRLPG